MEIYCRKDLEEVYQKGIKLKILPFWGHKPKFQGTVDKSCFSQWFPGEFEINNVLYPTAEHYMMAEKARLFRDDENLKNILEASSPAKAKKLGRLVKNFDPEIWNKESFDIVVRGNFAKFNQNQGFKEFLLKTGKKVIVEASPFDKIWGIGMNHQNEKIHNPLLWNGLNLLGFALMKARDELVKKGG